MKKCEFERLCSLLRIEVPFEEYSSFSNYVSELSKNADSLSLIQSFHISKNKPLLFSSLREDEVFSSVDKESVLSSSKSSNGAFFRLKEGGNKP